MLAAWRSRKAWRRGGGMAVQGVIGAAAFWVVFSGLSVRGGEISLVFFVSFSFMVNHRQAESAVRRSQMFFDLASFLRMVRGLSAKYWPMTGLAARSTRSQLLMRSWRRR